LRESGEAPSLRRGEVGRKNWAVGEVGGGSVQGKDLKKMRGPAREGRERKGQFT